MSIRRLYQVMDRVADAVLGPVIVEKTDGTAIRIFHDALSDQRSMLGQHPRDFDLVLIGYQDERTGTLDPQQPQVIATGYGWVEHQQRAQAETEAGLTRLGLDELRRRNDERTTEQQTSGGRSPEDRPARGENQ